MHYYKNAKIQSTGKKFNFISFWPHGLSGVAKGGHRGGPPLAALLWGRHY